MAGNRARTLIVLGLLALSGCRKLQSEQAPTNVSRPTEQAPKRSEIKRELATLRALETAERSKAALETEARFERASGPDPYRIERHPDGSLVGLLRGEASLVVLDFELREISRAPTLRSPVALGISAAGDLFVSSDLQSELDRFRSNHGKLERVARYALAKGARLKALATGKGSLLYGVDEENDQLLLLRATGSTLETLQATSLPKGGFGLTRTSGHLLVNCLLDHSLTVYSLDPSGPWNEPPLARIEHDGPIWSAAALERPEGLIVALGGVEDHPLDRTIGSFGNIDSFAYLYRITAQAREKLQTINLSELGVLTPKTIVSILGNDGFRLEITGYGGWNTVTLSFASSQAPPAIETRPLPPGTAAAIHFGDHRVYANPLLDAWILAGAREVRVVPTESYSRAVEHAPLAGEADDTGNSKLGEALLFTYLMAPRNSSHGAQSRFTCETCHFEGAIDGRTHYTGRGDIYATTKPLLGLFNNPPYFSRALDRDLTEVVHNEFRVAGAGSGASPWFILETRDYPWLEYLGVRKSSLSAAELRASLLSFLMGFHQTPNPHATGRADFSPDERAGSALFAERCESCHQARRITNLAQSRIAGEAWADSIFREAAPLVWASDDYQQTGITPYVHERGARVPSLRRAYRKYPYFTNGSAKTLGQVLDRARFDDDAFFHDHAPGDRTLRALNSEEKAALVAFLRLL